MTLRDDWASELAAKLSIVESSYIRISYNVPIMPVYRLVLPWVSAKKGAISWRLGFFEYDWDNYLTRLNCGKK